MIYIWVRATTNWEDEETFRAQLAADLEPKVDVWNETFTMPFHLFRHRLRQIAKLNHSRVENAVCADWDTIPEGGLVVPVDDDDWFDPELGGVLETAYEPPARGCYWTSSFFEVPIHFPHRLGLIRRRIFPGTRPKFVCTTNNYAMVKGPGARDLLEGHVQASHWLENEEPGALTRIERRLSAMNRTLASRTSLAVGRPSITRSQLIRKFHKYRKLYDRVNVPELAWAAPYLAMMSDLMAELRIRDVR
jgi:hypothetical protein